MWDPYNYFFNYFLASRQPSSPTGELTSPVTLPVGFSGVLTSPVAETPPKTAELNRRGDLAGYLAGCLAGWFWGGFTTGEVNRNIYYKEKNIFSL